MVLHIDVIGEMEMLNSLANFGIQSRFCLPNLNTNYEIDFKGLSHPC
jgi:DNA mismatch repair ATPase MutS